MIFLEARIVLDGIRRRWWVVLSMVVLGALVGALPAPKTATDTVNRWNAGHTLLLSNSADVGTIQSNPVSLNQIKLFAVTGEVPKRAAEKLNFAGSAVLLASQIKITVDPESGSIRLATTQNSADSAVAVADTFADELTNYLVERQDALQAQRIADSLKRQDELKGKIDALQAKLVQQPGNAVLTAQLDGLTRQYSAVFEQYDALQVTDVQLQLTTLERASAIPIARKGLLAPSSRTSRGILGGLVGGIIGIGIAMLLSRVDRVIRTHAQAESIFGLRSQVSIPEVKDFPAGLVAVPGRHDALSDAYRKLRSVVSFVERGAAQEAGRVPVIVVVSAGAGDGKSTVAANLASAFAESGVRTIAMNTDFRRPTLSKYITGNDSDTSGFVASNIAKMPLSLLLNHGVVEDLVVFDLAGVEESPGELARLTAGFLPKMAEIGAGVVVVDTSPVDSTAEVLELVPIADLIVIVARVGRTNSVAAYNTVETLRALTEQQILLVLVEENTGHYGYSYSYSYASPYAPKDQPRNRRRGTSPAA